MRIKAINLRLAVGKRTGVMSVVRMAILAASTLWILVASPLALYPGAQLDQEFEREHLRNPKSELKQYITADSFDKVIAFYKKIAPEASGSTINTKTHRRMAFRDKGDEKNSTTVEWSDEAGDDKSKTFILVDTAK
jgi:hypothetical protein